MSAQTMGWGIHAEKTRFGGENGEGPATPPLSQRPISSLFGAREVERRLIQNDAAASGNQQLNHSWRVDQSRCAGTEVTRVRRSPQTEDRAQSGR